MLCRKSLDGDNPDNKNEVDTNMEKGKKREPVRFKISEDDDETVTEALIPPQIVVDPPSKQTSPDQPTAPPKYDSIDSKV